MEHIVNIIFFAGALQGFILTFLLFTTTSNRLSNRILGILSSSWAIILLLFALQSYDIYLKYPHVLFTVEQLLFTWFPLLFLSVKYLITKHKHFNKIDLLHFLPVVFVTAMFSGFYFKSGEEKIALISNPEGFYKLATMICEEILIVQGLLYSILILIILNNYNKRVVDYHANVDQTILKWLRIGVILSLIAWIFGIGGSIAERAEVNIGIDLFMIVYLIFVVVIYILSIIALRTREVFKLNFESLGEIISIGFSDKSSHKTDESTTSKRVMVNDEFETKWNNMLIAHMEETKPFLNPDLSLQNLADEIGISRHQLSAVINEKQKMNFFEFVNKYRTNEVIDLMKDKSKLKVSNFELAYEAGFNSKATFYRIFKQFTGKTPSEFRANISR